MKELHQVCHLFKHRIGPTPSNGQVNFETGLRTYGIREFKDRERKWTTVPFKDKKYELTQMYPSYEETMKIKTWSTKNLNIKTHSGFQGYLDYPPLEKLEDYQPRNCSETKHLYYPGQLMSTVNWELSMRDYGDRMKKKQEVRESVKELKEKAQGLSRTKDTFKK